MQQDLKREVEAIQESLQQHLNYLQTIDHPTCATILLEVLKIEFRLEHQDLVHKDNHQTLGFTDKTTKLQYLQEQGNSTNPLQTEVEFQILVVVLAY